MKRTFLPFIAGLLASSAALAGMDHAQHAGMTHQMSGMYGPYTMSREASGTAWVPDSSPHGGIHRMSGPWMWMLHGYATQVYDHQSGPRGDTKNFMESMVMAMAQRSLGPGVLGLRGMFSLDPAMGKNGYPLLYQTGETADNQTHLVDRQHPHDLLMELAVSYSLLLDQRSSLFVYAGLPGEPALGPPAFMHRFSGVENPEAPITHHWLDSTHITFGVVTLGYVLDKFKVEASAFNGREPDEKRWNIDQPRLDSYSSRLTWNPRKDWSGQVSWGRVHSPEQLEPDLNVKRMTASLAYNRPFKAGNWQTTGAWGQNQNEAHGHERRLDAYLLESAVSWRQSNTAFARGEWAEKDELFGEEDPRAGTPYKVAKLSLGYVRDIAHFTYAVLGLGASGTLYSVPSAIKDAYGSSPHAYMIFARLKLGESS